MPRRDAPSQSQACRSSGPQGEGYVSNNIRRRGEERGDTRGATAKHKKAFKLRTKACDHYDVKRYGQTKKLREALLLIGNKKVF